MFSSVRWPLALAFFLLTALSLAAVELVLFESVKASYLASVESGLRQECSFIANLMRRHMDQVALTASARKMITDEMAQLSLQMSGRLCIVNWRGDVLEDSARRKGENVGARREIKAALSGREEMVIRGLERAEPSEDWEQVLDPTMFVAVPMRAKGVVVGAVYGSRSLADLQLMLVDLRERLYAVIAVTLVVGLIVSLALARGFTAPLRRLTAAAKRLGEGHLEERLQIHSKDELGSLARSFNEMAESLKLQHERILQFVSDASHELKTPLASLRCLIEALEAGAPQEKFHGMVHRDLDRMEKLVQDLLQLHRVDRAALKLEMRTFKLKDVLDEYDGLEHDCPPGARIHADPDRLRQVLTNLVVNAQRATKDVDAPRVHIHVQPKKLVVEDNGAGIAQDHLEKIFDRFFRVDSNRSRGEGGTGLGLAITRGLVEAMGGKIRAESDGPGKGARFVIEGLAVTEL